MRSVTGTINADAVLKRSSDAVGVQCFAPFNTFQEHGLRATDVADQADPPRHRPMLLKSTVHSLRHPKIVHIQAHVERLRAFLTLLALLFATVAVSAPAAARGMHGLSHAETPVANGQHHHHDDEGGVATHGAENQSAPKSGDPPGGGFGHSHMATSAFDALPQPNGDLQPSMVMRPASPPAGDTSELSTLGWLPQIRPPRTA